MTRRVISDGELWRVVTEQQINDLVKRNYVVSCNQTCGMRNDGHLRAGDAVYHLLETWRTITEFLGSAQ